MKKIMALILAMVMMVGALPQMTYPVKASESTESTEVTEVTDESLVSKTEEEHIHEYTAEVTDATCTGKGYTTLVCEGCGDTKLASQTTDITNLFDWTSGKMVIATTGACQDYADWQASDYVDVSSFDSIQILTANTIHTGTTAGLAFYDVNKKYISGVKHTDGVGKEYGTLLHTLEIPENAVYIRSTWYLPSHPNYSSVFGEFSCIATGQYVPGNRPQLRTGNYNSTHLHCSGNHCIYLLRLRRQLYGNCQQTGIYLR